MVDQIFLKYRKIIINKVHARIVKYNMKIGIDIPTIVLEGKRIYTTNKNDLWAKAIQMKIKIVRIIFLLLEYDTQIPVRSKII